MGKSFRKGDPRTNKWARDRKSNKKKFAPNQNKGDGKNTKEPEQYTHFEQFDSDGS